MTDAPSSGDHKVIGRLWIYASLLMGLGSLVLGALVGLERADTGGIQIFQGSESYFQVFTLFRVSFVFLFVVPLLIGLATLVVPLQIGAPSVAYPRAASTAFWTWLVGGIILIVSWLIDGGLVPGGNQAAVELSILAMGVVVMAIILATTTIVVTVITERSAGMGLNRVPLFSWSMLVAGGVWLLSLPVLLANLAVMWIDIQGDAAARFGLGENLFDQVAWVFDQPQVFAFALPLLGIAGDVMPVAFRSRMSGYGIAQGAIGVFGALSFGAFAQSFFNDEILTNPVYVVSAVLLSLPVLAILGGWGLMAAQAQGGPRFSGQLVLSVAATLALLAAGAIATVRVLGALIGGLREIGFDDELGETTPLGDLPATSIAGAMFVLVLTAGLIGAVAGLHFWAPKIFGRKLNPGLGVLAALSLLGGAMLSAVPDTISGFLDQPDFLPRGTVRDGVEVLNIISLVGIVLVFGGVALVLLNIAQSFVFNRDGEDDEDAGDPWGGHTLEWLTPSPPPVGNFAGPVTVSSERPLLDADFAEANS